MKIDGMKRLAAVALAVAGMVLGAADMPAEYQVPLGKWNLGRYGKLAGEKLTVTVPAQAKAGMNCASAALDLKPYRGQSLYFLIRARAKDVSKPRQPWNGVKFMLIHKSADGREFFSHPSNLFGSFDWKELSFTVMVDPTASKGSLLLGLQDSSGEVEFDLDSLRICQLFPHVKSDYKVSYPDRVKLDPPRRGVMSPHKFTEDDFRTLHEWGVNLVRAQLTRGWGKANTDLDLAEYDRWINGKLDHLDEALKLAQKYGIKMVIDLHSPPGGRNEMRNMRMFFEKKYADHFIEVWKRIAKRFKGNPAVWGYDLINEPVQSRPAKYDYLTIQRMAAEAVRAIDPDTPIIIESNEWDSPPAFRYLTPIPMDNVIYQVHMYQPGTFTHQGVGNSYGEQGKQAGISYPGRIDGAVWNKETLRRSLQPVRDFQLKHNARIFVGEFSAIAWAPGAAPYLRDCIELFEEYGWDWTYHAFREWDGWSVEHEGSNAKNLKPSASNDRKTVLLEGFRKNRK